MGDDVEGRIVVSTYPERAKARNAKRNPQASVCVLSDTFNGEWVQVDGRIEVVEQPEAIDDLVGYYRSMSGEHPDWEEYRQAMLHRGKVPLRMSIQRWGPISRGGFPSRLVEDGLIAGDKPRPSCYQAPTSSDVSSTTTCRPAEPRRRAALTPSARRRLPTRPLAPPLETPPACCSRY